ncbi:class III signal peptide-containing protein [Thermococcus sp. 21S9]|uniref:class III signal peptide-containing protein n=1 Tax=Thermococcus sp. 21S9 TaxID=1638223 RepID=UPI00143B57CB|nr:class III signal peptide-containing protein [Thermococcus sp. 21S9]NJE54613.1 class III signal peptide-containing protein [Thermococcus sp. 21S9]
MGLVFKRRGQISLEFMLVFSIMLIMLLYSVKNVGFDSNSPSSGTLAIQMALEEKSVANVIAGAIDQVYAQGPGSKVTVYAHFNLLRNSKYITSAFNVTSPQVQLLFLGTNDPLFPAGAENSVVAVAVANSTVGPVLTGSNRTGVWVQTYFLYNATSPTGFVVALNPADVPGTMKVVVEWNPAKPVLMVYNSTSETLYINIKPGA